jgi:hypothetical protein
MLRTIPPQDSDAASYVAGEVQYRSTETLARGCHGRFEYATLASSQDWGWTRCLSALSNLNTPTRSPPRFRLTPHKGPPQSVSMQLVCVRSITYSCGCGTSDVQIHGSHRPCQTVLAKTISTMRSCGTCRSGMVTHCRRSSGTRE